VSRAEAERSRARSDLDRLKKAYERQKDLWAAGATARLTFEKSEKDYKEASAAAAKLDAAAGDAAAKADSIAHELETAKHSIEERTAAIDRARESAASGEIHAPADGIVLARHGQPGDHVDRSTKLLDLATELTALEAVVSPDAATLGRVHAGQAAVIRMGDQEIAGVVEEVRSGEVLIYFNAGEPVKKLDDAVQVRIKF
jgi:multidrug resistance efflux pump